MMYVQPFAPVYEVGITELVGINEQVDQNDYGGSIAIDLHGSNVVSGKILSFLFISTKDGSGAVQTPAGKLLILDADPAVAAGDTALDAAKWPTVISVVDVAASDWISDANGGVAYVCDQPVPFHDLTALYVVWLHEDATSFNDAAGDDEQLEFNCWYRRDS